MNPKNRINARPLSLAEKRKRLTAERATRNAKRAAQRLQSKRLERVA